MSVFISSLYCSTPSCSCQLMMNSLPLLLTVVQALAVLGQTDPPTPVVLWHGMGDSAAGMIGIQVGRTLIQTRDHTRVFRTGLSCMLGLVLYGIRLLVIGLKGFGLFQLPTLSILILKIIN